MMKDQSQTLSLGVDLGGTKIETALVDPSGQVVASTIHPTRAQRDRSEIIKDIVTCARSCLGKASAAAVSLGIGVAGQVDARTGTVRFAPNLGWRDVPFKAALEQALHIPVTVVNDVRAATWAEWQYGVGRACRDLVCLFLGTGVGGGIVSGGVLLEGDRNSAGELGHVPVVANGRPCHCRNRGCLEAYVGGWALSERAREAVAGSPGRAGRLAELAAASGTITAAMIAGAGTAGDPVAIDLIEETSGYLATGIIGFVNALNPALVILGGGVAGALPQLLSMAEARVKKVALETAVEHLRIEPAALGNHAGSIGAAGIARSFLG